MYWNNILNEIRNKNAANQFFAFTSCGDKNKNTLKKIRKNTIKRIPKSYFLGTKYPSIYLTKREAECMVHLLKGKTLNRVGEQLNLSPRTVEFYLKNIKAKLRCRSKYQVIEKILDSDFLNNVDFA